MLKRANINWNARQLAKMARNGTVRIVLLCKCVGIP